MTKLCRLALEVPRGPESFIKMIAINGENFKDNGRNGWLDSLLVSYKQTNQLPNQPTN